MESMPWEDLCQIPLKKSIMASSPWLEHRFTHTHTHAAFAEEEKGTIYTDATGALPVMSLNGHQYYIVAYDYDNNFIEAKEISDLKDETIVEAVQKIFDKMEARGHRPLQNVTDNQAAQQLKAF